MTKQEFERACRTQNQIKAVELIKARMAGEPCDLETMFAFGGVSYCRTHGVMGECPYGRKVQS